MSTAALVGIAIISLFRLHSSRIQLEWQLRSIANFDVPQWLHCKRYPWDKGCSQTSSETHESPNVVILDQGSGRRLRSNGDAHSSKTRSTGGDTKWAKNSGDSASSTASKAHEHSSSHTTSAHAAPNSNAGNHGGSSARNLATMSLGNGCLSPETVRHHHRPYFLAMGVVLRQEASFVEEWARFHLAEGVDHFYMIDQETTTSSSNFRGLSESTTNSVHADIDVGSISSSNSSSGSSMNSSSRSRKRRRTESSNARGGDSAESNSELAPNAVGQRMWYRPPNSATKSGNSDVLLLLGATATVLENALPGRTTHLVPPTFTALDKERSEAAVAKEASLKRTHLSVANMPAMLGSYHRIVAAAKHQATWLLLIDSDEFMYASSPTANIATTLKTLEAKHPLTGQVSVPWEVFGSSGHLRQPRCQVASFTWRLPWSLRRGKAQLVKSIVRPDAIRTGHKKLSVHRTEKEALCPRWLSLSADGVPLDGEMPPASTAHFSSSGVPGVVSQSCVAALSNHESSSSSKGTATSSTPSSTTTSSTTTTSSSTKQSHGSSRTPPHNMDWPRPGSALLRLNHYMYRSRDFALRVKACRALPAAGKSGKDVDAAGILATLRDVDAATTVCDTYAAERQRYGTNLSPSTSPTPAPPSQPHAQCPPSLEDLSVLAASVQRSPRRLQGVYSSRRNHSSVGTARRSDDGVVDNFIHSKSMSSPESVKNFTHQKEAARRQLKAAASAHSATPSKPRQATEARAWKAGLYADLGPGCGVPEPDPNSLVEQRIHKVQCTLRPHGMREDVGILSCQKQSRLPCKGLVPAPAECLLARWCVVLSFQTAKVFLSDHNSKNKILKS